MGLGCSQCRPGAVFIFSIEEAVALLAARRLQHEPLVVGVQYESEEERDAHLVKVRVRVRGRGRVKVRVRVRVWGRVSLTLTLP